MEHFNFVQAKPIVSPISGQYSHPKITTTQREGNIFEEAVWIDYTSGQFIRRGIISIVDKDTGKRRDITTG